MAMRPLHRVYLPGIPLWPYGRFIGYTFQVPIMAMRPFHKVINEILQDVLSGASCYCLRSVCRPEKVLSELFYLVAKYYTCLEVRG